MLALGSQYNTKQLGGAPIQWSFAKIYYISDCFLGPCELGLDEGLFLVTF